MTVKEEYQNAKENYESARDEYKNLTDFFKSIAGIAAMAVTIIVGVSIYFIYGSKVNVHFPFNNIPAEFGWILCKADFKIEVL